MLNPNLFSLRNPSSWSLGLVASLGHTENLDYNEI